MLEKIKTKFFTKEFIVFCFIGAINTGLAQLIYLILVANNLMEPGISSLIGDVLTIAVSYVLNMKLTYHEKMSIKSALSFPISYIPGTIINMLVVLLVVDVFHFSKIIAKAISLPLTIPLNFIFVSIMVKITRKGDK